MRIDVTRDQAVQAARRFDAELIVVEPAAWWARDGAEALTPGRLQ